MLEYIKKQIMVYKVTIELLIAGMEVRPAEENESVRFLRPPPLWGSGVSDFLLPVQWQHSFFCINFKVL